MDNRLLFLISFFYCITIFSIAQAEEVAVRQPITEEALCTKCLQNPCNAGISNCICNGLLVTGDAQIQDNLTIEGKIKAKKGIRTSKIEASTFKTSCGSSLNCDLSVENNAKIENNLSVGGTITANTLDVGTIDVSSIIASDIETSCGSSLSCNLFVENDATVTNNLSVGGTVTSNIVDANTISGSLIETTCGSSLSCDLLVHDSATINNELTVGCDITVGCNILMNNSTDASHGNILKNNNRFMHNSGTNNTFLGQNSGKFGATGTDNTGIGFQTLTGLTSGTQNTALGSQALTAVLLGQDNTAIGYAALQNTTNEFNCCTPSNPAAFPAFCNPSGCLYIGNANTAIGSQALQNNLVGQNNVAIGSSALAASTTQFNTHQCETLPPANATQAAGAGGINTDFCTYSGDNNTALGTNSLSSVTIGSNNIAVGYSAGSNSTGGWSNIYIGNEGCITSTQPSLAGFPTLAPGTNFSEHNTIRIGDNNVHTDTFIAAVYGKPTIDTTVLPVYINSNGELCTTLLSSERFKEQITSLDVKTILEKLMQLNTVSFFYKSKNIQEKKKEQIGLIAEQVATVFPELVVFDQEGKPLSVRYELLAVLCIAALQSVEKQQQDTVKTIESLQKQVQELQMHFS